MTKSEAVRILALLQGAYPRAQIPQSTAELYAMALADVPFDRAKAAVLRIIQTSKWMPTVAEIRGELAEADASLPGPEEAWGHVQRAIGSVGSYRNPVFEVEEINQAVTAIGWRNICLDENTAATRARFIDAYRHFRRRRIERGQTGQYQGADRQLPTQTAAELGSCEHGETVLVRSEWLGERPLALVSGDDK